VRPWWGDSPSPPVTAAGSQRIQGESDHRTGVRLTKKRIDEQAPKGRAWTALDVRCGAAPCIETMRANTGRSVRPAARGLTLRCVSGLLVVTQTGDLADHELRPGDVFRTDGRGLVVAWAIHDSGFVVSIDTEIGAAKRAA
jgi:hypothetical protein